MIQAIRIIITGTTTKPSLIVNGQTRCIGTENAISKSWIATNKVTIGNGDTSTRIVTSRLPHALHTVAPL